MTTRSYVGKVDAREFPDGLDWINTSKPLKLADLRGKVVVMDFWTFCCINCMHMIPQLDRLEKRFPNELVVVGVHSPKFPHEKETANLRKAVMRLGVRHPVLNDHDFAFWRKYGLRSWPTLLFLDPQGKVFGIYEGEATTDMLAEVVKDAIDEYDRLGWLDRRPLPFQLEREDTGPLLFPGKVLADAASNLLFIADSNHHRIVVSDLAGNTQEVIGSGFIGFNDGAFGAAAFNAPQGMALAGDVLYIADNENHSIRAADLKAKTVTTVAGVGTQALGREQGGHALDTALSSPWDLAYRNGLLYIAMAGMHQIWTLDIARKRVMPFAGSGAEGIVDGPIRSAQMAQPSGLSLADDPSTGSEQTPSGGPAVLYVADSETSSIRFITLEPGQELLRTIVGVDLFAFGDKDGIGNAVRLQHALGVCHHDGILYVADTYNNKIKKVFPRTQSSMTWLGTGQQGKRDGAGALAEFHEPGGLSVANGKLYIADTNNHAVRVADLATAEVSTLELKGLGE
jgi:thiol-disulfide isomerase/thioredoxin